VTPLRPQWSLLDFGPEIVTESGEEPTAIGPAPGEAPSGSRTGEASRGFLRLEIRLSRENEGAFALYALPVPDTDDTGAMGPEGGSR
jgi:hypothetical protein